MEQLDLKLNFGDLFEAVTSESQLRAGFKSVKRNGGAPGTDGVTIEEFEANLESHLRDLSGEVRQWRYRPHPVKRVRIPKPGTTKTRMIGIPCVRDRVLQFSLKISLERIFDPGFSPNSFGFRPGRGQREAIDQAKELIGSGLDWIVDIDLETFFDTINHDRIINLVGRRVSDNRILRLIGLTLRSGALEDNEFVATEEGSVQGSPLSPLLSNIVLDELDRELDRRGLKYCRYADDCNVFVGSRKAAERVLGSLTRFIEGKLKLKVNRAKSKAAPSNRVKFLGMTIVSGMIAISAASMKKAREKVKDLIPRRTHMSLEQQTIRANQWYSGWTGYYGMTELPSQLRTIEARMRVRFRLQFLRNQKRRKHIVRKLKERGIRRDRAYETVYSNKGLWALAHSFAVGQAWSNMWFRNRGLHTISTEIRPHWQSLDVYVKLL